MANLNDIINLAKADGGKFFVMDEKGDAKLVIMSVEDYQKLLLGKLQKQIQEQSADIEKINQEILKAQLQDPEITTTETAVPKARAPKVDFIPQGIQRQDLRAEVIDPSFDFEAPKVEIDDL